MYHLIKAMHMAGRCVACRQCELACPAKIPLTVLYDLIRQDVEELLGYVPGDDLAMGPPLSLTLEDAPLRAKVV
jgi:ferredoxin